jgi:A/G-specific adenine glycosylase
MEFGEIIISWYNHNKRDLPWRHTSDPYKIWLSEIMLQQTRVEQGLGYYEKFITKYPKIKNLAAASEDDILKLWQGLGYYSRARNLHQAAKDMMKRFKGKFPTEYKDILSLKGVGVYTASAIASFAYQQKHAVVDGNVFRVLSRYLGIFTSVDSNAAKTEFSEAALILMGDHAPHDFNQAIMEFGALHCKPANPVCGTCPLNGSCFAFSKNKVALLPVKVKKNIARNRYFNYLCIHQGDSIVMKKRTGNDIWKNLYDFPVIETDKRITSAKLFRTEELKKYFSKNKFHLISKSQTIRHQLTHQTIFARFYRIRVSKELHIEGIKSVNKKNLNKFAVPRLIENYLRSEEGNFLLNDHT